ncbi:hypothetical protein CBS101457_004799 [Exobasidium rhododendri]|nr:hypothetical protein CBS101457_004799 [Exobasidium rhododendri]
MATSSSWRSNNGPRWSQGGNGNNSSNHQSSGGAANSTPRSASSSIVRPNVKVATPSTAAAAPTSGAFPPLGVKGSAPASNDLDAIQIDRILYLLVGLVGNTVVATTKSGIKYVGILSSTSVPDDGNESMGIILSSAQQILNESSVGPLKKMLIIRGEDLDGFSAKDVGLDVPVSMGSANRAGFRTDTEISKKILEPFGEGRILQKWADDPESKPLEADGGAFGEPHGASAAGGGGGGGGGGRGLGGWDQFAANEAKFGIKSNYEENLYTTKLDKSSRDYKEREKRADQLAKEIMNSSTNNIHVAEERNLTEEGEDAQTEEDRYGAVVRGPNAYVPPAARRAAAAAAVAGVQSTIKANGAAREDKANGSQSTLPPPTLTVTGTPTLSQGSEVAIPTNTGPDAVGEFRQFVTSERERMEKKKAALAKKEKDSRLADLKNWGDKFKLKFPLNDEGKAAVTNENGAALEKPRDASLHKNTSPPATLAATQSKEAGSKGDGTASVAPSPKEGASAKVSTTTGPTETKATFAKMTIPKIPPFNADKARAKMNEAAAAAATNAASPNAASASKNAFKLSATASSFKPFNPNATSFTPGGAPPPFLPPHSNVETSTASPRIPSGTASSSSLASPALASVKLASTLAAAATTTTSTTVNEGVPASSDANPFFGSRVIKKPLMPLHVREDFNPFKNGKVPESQTIGPTWGFTGKGYRTLFYANPGEESANTSMNSPHLIQLPPPPPPPSSSAMTPLHNMVTMAMHPHAGMGQQGSSASIPPPPPPPHMQQQQPQLSQPNMTPNNGQPFYMPYGVPQGAPTFRFPGAGGQQGMQQMAANYGQMPPQYMPFSPSMPPTGQAVYSPQMGSIFPPGASMHTMGGVPPNQQMQQQQPRSARYYANGPFPPSVGGPPGAMSPNVRHHHQPQHHQQHHPQQQHHPYQQQQNMPAQPQQGHHSAAASQAGSTAG